MPTKDSRVDAYIAEAAEFARPILKHLRRIIHEGCPPAVETIKWGCPCFDYKGLFCGIAAFKAHCALFFWRDLDVSRWAKKAGASGMGQFGRITTLSDLPKDSELLACVRAAAKQRDARTTTRKRTPKPVKEPPIPPDLKKAFAANPRAATAFKNFPPSHRREYLKWIGEAKQAATRERRLRTAIAWIADGKPQNWKYVGVP